MIPSLGAAFADGAWYHSLSNQFTRNYGDMDPYTAIHLADNQNKPFLERYFDAVYMPDVGGELFNDICVLRHSNTLCIVGLAPAHHLFKGCLDPRLSHSQNIIQSHNVLGLDFKISEKVHRLCNRTSGRRKRGGQTVGRAPNVFAFAVCDRSVKHKIMCGVPGRLLEVNAALAHSVDGRDQTNITVPFDHSVHAPVQANLSPLYVPNSNYEQIGHFLCIISPSRLPRHLRKRRSDNESQEIYPASINSSDGDESEGGNAVSERDWISRFSELTGENILTWNQYSQLRML